MKFLPFLLLLSATTGVCALAESKPARKITPARRTVRDYYLLLPRQYFAESPRENLRLRPMVSDIAGDYLQTRASDSQAHITTKLFRFRGADVFAAQISPVYKVPITSAMPLTILKFYRLNGGKLQDVTTQIWPVKLGVNQMVYLPRRGTTIVVKDENDTEESTTLFKMLWRQGRFVKTR